MVTDPTRALEWMIGLPDIAFLGAQDGTGGEARIHVETKALVAGCPRCGVLARVKDRSAVELVDLPLFERTTRLVLAQAALDVPRLGLPHGLVD